MATLAREEMTVGGLNATYNSAAAGGDEFANDERTVVHIVNGDASPHTATFTKQKDELQAPDGYGPIALSDLAVVIPAGEDRFIRVPPAIYNDGNGRVQVTYDAVTSVTVAVIHRPND